MMINVYFYVNFVKYLFVITPLLTDHEALSSLGSSYAVNSHRMRSRCSQWKETGKVY